MMHGALTLVICLLPLVVSQYLRLPYGDDGHIVGPDGPWWTLRLSVGSLPERNVSFHPIVGSSSSWWITTDACSRPNIPCVASADRYFYNQSTSAREDRHLRNTTSTNNSTMFGTGAQVMNYTATGRWHYDSVRLTSSLFARDVTQVVSSNTFITHPGGVSYVPLSTMSLGTEFPTLIDNRTGSPRGTSLVSEAVTRGTIGVRSYSLHLGSVEYNQTGSIILGGYDGNRIIGVPAVYNDNNFAFRGVSLKKYNDTSEQQILSGLSLRVRVDPSVPYLYLPGSVCIAMAEVLPVTFNQALNLYLWNGNNTWDQDLVNRLSYFTFQFNAVSISVPLALLYLTLDAPLATPPTRYFPCYPSVDTFVLGRAFLQSAFYARLLDSVFLGQAPGPSINSDPQVQVFRPNQLALTTSQTSISWASTWAVLNGTNNNRTNGTDNNSNGDNLPSNTGAAISAGGIAGIVIGSAILLALLGGLCIWLRRRKHSHDVDHPIEIEGRPAQYIPYDQKQDAGPMKPGVKDKNQSIMPAELDLSEGRHWRTAAELE